MVWRLLYVTVKNIAGVIEGGAASTSGLGDGCYTFYTVDEEDGEVITMKIVFIDKNLATTTPALEGEIFT